MCAYIIKCYVYNIYAHTHICRTHIYFSISPVSLEHPDLTPSKHGVRLNPQEKMKRKEGRKKSYFHFRIKIYSSTDDSFVKLDSAQLAPTNN